jgi:XTP/dITP diphosphohydrolase
VDGLTLTLCSQNEHKRRELAAVLDDWTIVLLDATTYPDESGATFYENARAKADFGRDVGSPGTWMLGEDSGLEIAALGGAPGVQTARWAEGRHVERALEALAGRDERSARYVCELVVLTPDGDELRGTGMLAGGIATAARGAGGFGFDPVFVPAGETRTVAELGDAWKTEHSHRALAARALRGALEASPS